MLSILASRAKVSVVAVCVFSVQPSWVQANPPIAFSEQEINSISAHGPWPMSVPDDVGNALSGQAWAESLGQRLFSDTTLSGRTNFSCATCHAADKGFSDGLPVAVGAQQGVRNTQGLFDVGLQRWFGWDGGADSLWSASLRPMLAEHEMNGTIQTIANALRVNDDFTQTVLKRMPELSKQSDKSNAHSDTGASSKPAALAFLTDEEIAVLAAKSIGAFMRTLRSEQTPFDKYRVALLSNDVVAQQAYPESAKRGLKIFLGEANCRACHFGPNFSNNEFHDTGRPFFTGVGQVDPGRYTGIKRVQSDPYNLLGLYADTVSQSDKIKTANVKLSQSNWGQWRTPSLRNLKNTAPYMHDGSLASLRDVVDHYADIDPARLHADGESFLKPLQLDSDQRNDLVEFLMSLSPDN